MKIDCHVHLVGISPQSTDEIPRRLRTSLGAWAVTRQLGLHKIFDPHEQERAYVERVARMVVESELDRAVLLPFDRVYDAKGLPDRRRTHMYVSNDAVFSACRRFPDHLLPGASVNPKRCDALDELERVAGLGAVLVKLLPNTHGFDPSDRRFEAYYRKLADLGLCLLIHGGYEHTVKAIDQSFGNPALLELALDQGVTVIVAHAGTAGLFHWNETFGAFLKLLERYPGCFGDLSALTNVWRARYLKMLLAPERLERKYRVRLDDPMDRMIHGTDFPIPITPSAFAGRTSAKQRRRIRKNPNYLQRDIDLKRLLGVPDTCLTRAYLELGIGRKG